MLKKADTPENEIDDQLKPLKNEDATLSKIDWDLHYRAMHAEPQDKAAIMAKRAENYQKLQDVRNKIAILEDQKDKITLEKLIRERHDDMLVYVNGNRTKIPENLEITIPFSCGRHSLTLKVYEVISHQTTIENCSNGILLGRWQSLLSSPCDYQHGILCSQCVKEKWEWYEKTKIIQENPTGQAIIHIKVVP